ncbi:MULTISPECIES: M56 family metallopeptidase [Streptomyces]|jgi:Zn-dependent protease with chaperone function|uniref:M56 family metallopeptidase n=1 Tax=Streptomyces spinosisporus TaxID=2927582 RepID=A0ABS9XF13_9ACTN|nr:MULTISPECIES: M56 family metallopeptidase [Streptomyces]MCI3240631.1 M56 family metallopeptidase [Streptomyces spinosisporus]WUB37210.1 M56 family metallopeptidase [Streptomyces sp. NBC_00588]
MGVFVFLPLVLPLTAWPIARLATQRLHPRTATLLLTGVSCVMALCSTVCLALLMVVGTAQLPGNPLPDGWSDPEVRESVPHDEIAGKAAIPALITVVTSCGRALLHHFRFRWRAHQALADLPSTQVAVLPDPQPYAYALPGGPRDRIVVSTAMIDCLGSRERRALFAHERTHLAAGHHRHLLLVQLAACANPFLRPLRTAVGYTAERWADEEAAQAVGSRKTVARAIGKAALVSRGTPVPTLASLAAPGPLPRRIAALLGPPAVRTWPPVFTAAGLALWTAASGALLSATLSANSAFTLLLLLHAATPL